MHPDDPVEVLLARCLEAPEPTVALAELCREHPDHAAALRARFAALAKLGMVPAQTDANTLPRIAGFALGALLGRGGMGLVYAATAEANGAPVAVKLMLPGIAWLPGRRERFQRESAVLQRLEHPGIVRILAVGEAQGLPYLVMEHVAGRSLAEVLDALRDHDPATLTGHHLQALLGPDGVAWQHLSWPAAASHIAKAVAEALAHVHGRAILHRDVKSSNVLVTATGRVVLIDFGLAGDAEATTITVSGANLGSLPYMPPETLLGEGTRFDPRVDVYGVGVLLYELLTLRLPFRSDSAPGLRAAILAGDLVPPRSITTSLARDLESVCLQAMAADPQRRYADATALADDLGNVLAMRAVAARPEPRRVRWWRRMRARPLRTAVVLALALSTPIGGGALIWWLRNADAAAAGATLRRLEDYEELLTTGFLQLEQGQRDLALATLQGAEPLAEGDPMAVAGRMLALINAGSPEAALAAAGDHPDAGGIGELRVEALQRAGRGEVAEQLRRTLGDTRDPSALFLRGRAILESNERHRDPALFSKANELISLACALSPRPRLLFACERVHAAHHARDLTGVREGVAVLDRLWPGSLRAAFWSAFGKELVDPAAALAGYRRVVQREPHFLAARRNLAILLLAQNEAAAAQALAEATVELAPSDPEGWFQLGMARHAQGDPDGATAAFRRTLALDPDHGPALSNVGLAEQRAGKLELAEQRFRRAHELSPTLAVPVYNLAVVLEDREQLAAALKFAREAVTLDPTYINGHRQLVRCLLRNRLHDEVRSELAVLVALDGKAEFTHELAVWVLDTLGDGAARKAEDARWATVAPRK